MTDTIESTGTIDQPWGGPVEAGRWDNWGGNQGFAVDRVVHPATEDEMISTVQDAVAASRTVRAAGSGHSFTPIVETKDVLMDLTAVTGLISTDPERHRATMLAGTTIADVGAPLWDAGLALANQGDVDAQTMSGAVATGTKGSGPTLGSVSSALRSARLVNGLGEVVDVTEDDPDLLHATQVSVGLLGVMTRLELQVVPRYRLVEENRVMPWGQLAEEWDHLLESYRHFSFWWCPFEASAAMYDLGDVPPDHAVVKLLREAEPGEPDVTDVPGARTDRSHRIYPDATTDCKFHELEYMVPAASAKDAVDIMRHLQLDRFPNEVSPLQIRWQKGDQGWMSPQYQRDTTSVSVSGVVGTDYEPFLRTVDSELQAFEARPHWGKVHYLTQDRIPGLYPRYEDFCALRERMDPEGLFLNDHLAELFTG